MALVASSVVRRFLASKSGFNIHTAGNAVPAPIAEAVAKYQDLEKTGQLPAVLPDDVLPPKVLLVWKYVVEKLGAHFAYDAAVKYWRNKCAMQDIALPKAFQEGLGGPGSKGRFKVMSGEQVDEWVKETLISRGLLDKAGQSADIWRMHIQSAQNAMAEAQAKIESHLALIAQGNRVTQRQQWIEAQKKNLANEQVELDKAQKALEEFEKATARYAEHKAPTLAFEREFQAMMTWANKEFSKDEVIKAVTTALDRFEKGLDVPAADGKTAFDIGGLLKKVWDALKKAWNRFTDWVSGLTEGVEKLNNLMDEADA